MALFESLLIMKGGIEVRKGGLNGEKMNCISGCELCLRPLQNPITSRAQFVLGMRIILFSAS